MNEDNTQPQSDEPSVGQILKTHRENANISLAKIASLLKLTESQVQHIENDKLRGLDIEYNSELLTIMSNLASEAFSVGYNKAVKNTKEVYEKVYNL